MRAEYNAPKPGASPLPPSWWISTGVAAALLLVFGLQTSATDAPGDWAEPAQIEPGVLDVQAWDWLQQDLERIIDQTRANVRKRLSPEAFEAHYVGATVEFLEIDEPTAQSFKGSVNKALDEIESAREDIQKRKGTLEPTPDEADAMHESRASWEAYRRVQRDAVHYPLAVLDSRPRHQLLREQMLAWLLRLDYGMNAARR